ncbi:MAG TPA: protein kinase, partial [Gemmatimonadaceae bacterium]|nr:protein kinase [Gemmatimonadaceae bacterium]
MAHTRSPEGIEALRDALAGRYSIRECCGQGGMASVYRAVDLRHNRDVAIKVLVPQLSSTLAVDRFLREIQIAAGLSHPHILPVFDSGEAGGMLYYVMPYVEGQTLQDRLDDRGPLSVNEVVRLGIELTDALEYAHNRGVVHRDVKPANILLQGTHATIADFGLARAIRAAGERQLTSDGWAVGTPLYMSPEQAMGGHELDGRTDIYSLGCVLFEALTGVPYADPTLHTILGHSAASPAERRADQLRHLPSGLRYALTKATAALPTERFATAREFGVALSTTRMRPRRATVVAAGAAIVGIALLLGGERLIRRRADGLVPTRVVVASLGNRTGAPELASLGEMAADWVTQGLQRSGLVDVVPTATVRNIERHVERTEPGSDPALQVASQTRAGLVVSGDIYREGDSLVVHVQLTNARQNRVAGSIDPVRAPVRGSRDALMTQLRSRIMGLLAVQLDQRIAHAPGASARPPAFEAYRRFNEGMELYSLHRPADALRHFRAARELDTGFVQAWLFEALMMSNVGRFAEADSLLDGVDARRDELSPHDRHWLDYRRALLAGRREEALRAIRDAAQLAPGSRASYNLAVEAMEAG